MENNDNDLFYNCNDNGAIISECSNYRYILWRTWDHFKKSVVFIGLNPSTADESINDRTISRCIDFARNWGYGKLMYG